VANEGKALVICAGADAEGVLRQLRKSDLGREAQLIGHVTDRHPGSVVMQTRAGGERRVVLPAGEELPRIC
jgi:hydrogenase expression/formation protein HypE